ncbi:hypothetical protein [Staphylococcus aureus]|uniref:hypothetical protein n=1 Tax=Staphylococcus aureus TaxID=1280 RepID=UPI00237A8113|nr:hypothetical protein [Staphylococcus aureus]MDD9396378.1 hypothetical protein [Staphylococcus aureus]
MTQIVNIVTGSTDVTFGGIILQGTSADGRITYRSDNDGPVIDGRKAFRGCWWHTQDRVCESDWLAACELMSDVAAAKQAECDRRADAAHAAQDARQDALAGIENVRGGAYDPNAR